MDPSLAALMGLEAELPVDTEGESPVEVETDSDASWVEKDDPMVVPRTIKDKLETLSARRARLIRFANISSEEEEKVGERLDDRSISPSLYSETIDDLPIRQVGRSIPVLNKAKEKMDGTEDDDDESVKVRTPVKKSASKKDLVDMHKESDRLMRMVNVRVNPRVKKKLDMSAFIDRVKSKPVAGRTLTESLESPKPKITASTHLSPSSTLPVRHPAFAPSSDESSTSEIDIIGGPNQADPNAHRPKAYRVLEHINPTGTHPPLLSAEAATIRARQKYRILSCAKSPSRKHMKNTQLSSSPQTPVEAMKQFNLKLRQRIIDQAALRRMQREKEARANGLWNPEQGPELIDADIPRNVFPLSPAAVTAQNKDDADFVASESDDSQQEWDSGVDDVGHTRDGTAFGMSAEYSGSESPRSEAFHDKSMDVGVPLAGDASEGDSELPLLVRRNSIRSRNRYGRLDDDEEDEREDKDVGSGSENGIASPDRCSIQSPGKERVSARLGLGLLDDDDEEEDFSALFVPSSDRSSRESTTQAWDNLRRRSSDITQPYSAVAELLPETLPYSSHPTLDTDEIPPARRACDQSDSVDTRYTPASFAGSQYVDSQGFLKLRKSDESKATPWTPGRTLPALSDEDAGCLRPEERSIEPFQGTPRISSRQEIKSSFRNASGPPDTPSQRESSQTERQYTGSESSQSGAEKTDLDLDKEEEGNEEDDEVDKVLFSGHKERQRVRNAYVDEEAEEEEDEFMGLGGVDGDESDLDHGEDLKELIEQRKITEHELRANEVRELHRKQIADEENRTVAQLIKDLDDGSGGLLRKRRGYDGGGLGFAPDTDSEDDQWDERRRRPGKRVRDIGPQNPLANDPKTAAFARAQKGPMMDEDDDPFASDKENQPNSPQAEVATEQPEESRAEEEEEDNFSDVDARLPDSPIASRRLFKTSVSCTSLLEDDSLKAIESQQLEILNFVNDHSAFEGVNTGVELTLPRRRLLDCSPSKLERFRSTAVVDSKAASMRGSALSRSHEASARPPNKRTVAFRQVVQQKTIVAVSTEPAAVVDRKGKGRVDNEEVFKATVRERKKKPGLIRLLDAHSSFDTT